MATMIHIDYRVRLETGARYGLRAAVRESERKRENGSGKRVSVSESGRVEK